MPSCLTRTLILSLLIVSLCSGPASAIPQPWAGNGHLYELITTRLPYDQANAAALAAGGYLATSTSAQENDFIFHTLIEPAGVTAWLGGYQDPTNPAYSEPAGGWVWATGEPFLYTNWTNAVCCHEPGDTPSGLGRDLGGNEDHLGINALPSLNGGWFDIHRDSALAYVVEYPVPEPATSVLLATGCLGLFLVRRYRRAGA